MAAGTRRPLPLTSICGGKLQVSAGPSPRITQRVSGEGAPAADRLLRSVSALHASGHPGQGFRFLLAAYASNARGPPSRQRSSLPGVWGDFCHKFRVVRNLPLYWGSDSTEHRRHLSLHTASPLLAPSQGSPGARARLCHTHADLQAGPRAGPSPAKRAHQVSGSRPWPPSGQTSGPHTAYEPQLFLRLSDLSEPRSPGTPGSLLVGSHTGPHTGRQGGTGERPLQRGRCRGQGNAHTRWSWLAARGEQPHAYKPEPEA